jgi:hypothetical protein
MQQPAAVNTGMSRLLHGPYVACRPNMKKGGWTQKEEVGVSYSRQHYCILENTALVDQQRMMVYIKQLRKLPGKLPGTPYFGAFHYLQHTAHPN